MEAVWGRGMARQVMDKADAVAHPSGAVGACIRGDPPGMRRGLARLEQPGLLPFFAPRMACRPCAWRGAMGGAFALSLSSVTRPLR